MSDQAARLRDLVSAAEPIAASGESAPTMVVVSGGCAGVGATTVALNLAAVLVDRGERVLVVDAAEQRNEMRDIAGVRRDVLHGLDDVVEGNCEIGEAIVAGPAGVAMVVARGRVSPRRGMEPRQEPADGGPLLRNLQLGRHISSRNIGNRGGTWCEARRDAVTWGSRRAHQRLMSELQSVVGEFDVVVVDAGCGMSAWVQRLWSRAGLVVLVTTPEDAAVLDAYAMLKHATADAAELPVRLLVNQAESDQVGCETHRRMENSCQKFLSRALPSLPALPRHLASEFVDKPAPPRVWEMPNSPFGHAALWLGKAVGDVLRTEGAGCGVQG